MEYLITPFLSKSLIVQCLAHLLIYWIVTFYWYSRTFRKFKQQTSVLVLWIFYTPYPQWQGHVVVQLVETLRWKLEGRGFDSRWCHWNFLLTLSLWPHYGPGVDSSSNRNEYEEYFLGIKAAGSSGSQSYHFHVPIFLKSWSLNPLEPSGSLQACNWIALPLHLPSLTPWLLHQGGVWSIFCNIAEFQSKPETV